MFGLYDTDIDEIRQILQLYQEIDAAILFGSRAMGRHKKGSDVDLAIKGQAINFDIVLNISDSLNEESNMPYHFDIVDYHSIQNKELKDHIDRVGKEIYQISRPEEEIK